MPDRGAVPATRCQIHCRRPAPHPLPLSTNQDGAFLQRSAPAALSGNPNRPATQVIPPSNWPLLPSHPHLPTEKARGSGTSSATVLTTKPGPCRPFRTISHRNFSSPHGLSHQLLLFTTIVIGFIQASISSPDTPCSGHSVPSYPQTLLFFALRSYFYS